MDIKKTGIISVMIFAFTLEALAGEGRDERFIRKFEASLDYLTGRVFIAEDRAYIDVLNGFRFLNIRDAKKVAEGLWGQRSDEGFAGLIFPPEKGPFSEPPLAFFLSYTSSGHVDDVDSDTLNPYNLIKDLKNTFAARNKEKASEGRQTEEIDSWAVVPEYDKKQKSLYWALRCSYSNEIQKVIILNKIYLGRNGFVSIKTIVNEDDFENTDKLLRQNLHAIKFNPGLEYDYFNPLNEKMSDFKLSDLITEGYYAEKSFGEKALSSLASMRRQVILIIAALLFLAFKKLRSKKTETP